MRVDNVVATYGGGDVRVIETTNSFFVELWDDMLGYVECLDGSTYSEGKYFTNLEDARKFADYLANHRSTDD